MPSLPLPIVRAWVRARYRVVDELLSTPCPDDHPSGHAAGPDPDRVLVLGNGPAVGWGVRSHDLALPGTLARALSARTGRGADVDALADADVTVATAASFVAGRDLGRYDAVVVVLGMSDALSLVSTARWVAGLSALLDALEEAVDPSCEIVVAGIQAPSSVPKFTMRPGGLVDSHAEALNRVTETLCAPRARVRVMVPPEPAAVPPGLGEPPRASVPYPVWAAALAVVLAPLIDSALAAGSAARCARAAPQTDELRIEAVRALGLLDTPAEKRFDDIVERTRVLLGTQGAAFSLIGDGRHWNKAIAGSALVEVPVASSFCSQTVRSGAPLVVPDAWRDDRFVSHPSVRFYAGHPVESPDGVRIGALCVVDAEPRSADGVDMVLLRELALQVQRELRAVQAAVPAAG
jgi:GAF domain-containing protein